MSSEQLLRLERIGKSFPGVRALSEMSFDVKAGEVHCICGENGAGKSTLIKVISGAHQPDEGEIYFEGKRVKLDPRSAMQYGIQTIYQEHNIFQHLSVTENIFTGLEISRFGFVQKKDMRRRTEEVLATLHCSISPDAMMSELSSGERKLIEIAKALVFKRKLIILDEPTASFSTPEITHLLDVIKTIKQTGLGIIYISHHLEEVFAIADRATVIRDGRKISTYTAEEIDEATLIRDMVGRDASAFYHRAFGEPGEVVLEAKQIGGNGVEEASFQLRRGEVLGFAGMVGSGRSELMHLLFGAERLAKGEIHIMGKKVNLKSPQKAICHKMCFITEDRQHTGLFLKHTIAQNTVIANYVNIKDLFISPARDLQTGEEYICKLGTKATSASVRVRNLSGGNQQKVVLAKWFLTSGDIFIFDEPTRGIDVGAKQEIYSIMLELLKANKAIIMVSSDMPEVVSMSDRVMVMKKGRVVAELSRENVSEENILSHSIGGNVI